MGTLRRGYTLVELLVVLAILAVLALLAMPLAELTVQRERERELKRALWEVRDAIDAYRRAREQGLISGPAGASTLPPTLGALTLLHPVAQPSNGERMIRFLRRVPRDPFADSALPAERTWGLRSYDSEARDPRPGTDVYDIHSLSPRIGLNGTPLKDW